MRPFLPSTDPLAIAGVDAAMARDQAGLVRFEAPGPGGSGLDGSAREAVASRAARDISTLQGLQNAEDGCEATACLTQARLARDADPAWARLQDCLASVPNP